MKTDMKKALTPGKILLIGGGLFVLVFSACAGAAYFPGVGEAAPGVVLLLATANLGILIVTIVLAIATAVGGGGTPEEYSLLEKRTNKEKPND